MHLIDRLSPSYRLGRARSRRDAPRLCLITVILTACATSAALGLAMLPGAGESDGALLEEPVPSGSWAIEWSPTMTPPAVEQGRQVRSLQLVAAGTAGLLSGLCVLVIVSLWGQRLRAQRGEHFVHWAVGAGPSQHGARLIGEAGAWWLGAGLTSVLAAVACAAAVRRTFPGSATLGPNTSATLIVLAGVAVLIFRWDRKAASGAPGSARLRLHELPGSPVPMAGLGVAILSGVGLLAARGPGTERGAGDGIVMVAASLSELPEGDRGESLTGLARTLGSSPEPVGIASAGAAVQGPIDTVSYFSDR